MIGLMMVVSFGNWLNLWIVFTLHKKHKVNGSQCKLGAIYWWIFEFCDKMPLLNRGEEGSQKKSFERFLRPGGYGFKSTLSNWKTLQLGFYSHLTEWAIMLCVCAVKARWWLTNDAELGPKADPKKQTHVKMSKCQNIKYML